jgi:serine/threonine-protein kinase RsbT
MGDEIRVSIERDADLVTARAEGRALAERLGFSRTDGTLIATAISEIARNIVIHAVRGEIVMRSVLEETRFGIVVTALDEGPGIHDIEAAIRDGYPSSGRGLGLPGARRLMDDFEVSSQEGSGTTVRMVKWRLRDELERLRERRRSHA